MRVCQPRPYRFIKWIHADAVWPIAVADSGEIALSRFDDHRKCVGSHTPTAVSPVSNCWRLHRPRRRTDSSEAQRCLLTADTSASWRRAHEASDGPTSRSSDLPKLVSVNLTEPDSQVQRPKCRGGHRHVFGKEECRRRLYEQCEGAALVGPHHRCHAACSSSTGGKVAKLVRESAVTCGRFSPDSKSLFTGTVSGVVREWDVSSRYDMATFRSDLPSISFVPADAK